MTLGIVIHTNYTLALGFQTHRVAVSPAASLSSQERPCFSFLCSSGMGHALGDPLGTFGFADLPSLLPWHRALLVPVGESRIGPIVSVIAGDYN